MKSTPKAKFEDRLRSMPAKPGVYIFRDAKDKVIYVGKAALLRNRVRSYFGSMHGFEAKTRRLVEQISDIEFILTGTVQEALLLEATLVKRHQPFFNVRLKDDKHYPYLKIDLKEQWPRVEITRRVLNDGARYFGPFASAGSVRRTLDLVKKLFPWRSCTKVITGEDPRPCLDYYIHRCIGPCASLCSKEEYDTVIGQTIMFLEGRTDEIGRDLRREMQAASEALEYERAARLRDQVQAIERTTERQVMEVRDRTDMDVFGLAREEQEAYVQVWFVRKGNVIGRDNFQLDGTVDEPDARVLASFIEQFYESAPYIPPRVLLPIAVEDSQLIEEVLSKRRGRPVRLMVPSRGEKVQLVERAAKNARESLQQARARWLADTGKKQQALEQLQDELEPAGAAGAHRVLRHLEHPGDIFRGLDGGVRGRPSAGQGVPALPDQGRHGRERLRDDAGGPEAAVLEDAAGDGGRRCKRGDAGRARGPRYRSRARGERSCHSRTRARR